MQNNTITISVEEYKDLIREMEKINIIKAIIEHDGYICLGTLKGILDMPVIKESEPESDEQDIICEQENALYYSENSGGVDNDTL